MESPSDSTVNRPRVARTGTTSRSSSRLDSLSGPADDLAQLLESPLDPTIRLLHAARDGEPGALERLLVRVRGRLLGRIRCMMGEEARRAAEPGDMLQDVCIAIVRRLPSFEIRSERAFLRWATEVARNNIRAAIRCHRERAFATLSSLGGANDDTDSTDSTDSPVAAAMRNESQHRLAEALERLPDDQRAAIELRDLDGSSYDEIGRTLGRSANAAQLLHTRAMVRLGELLEGPEASR